MISYILYGDALICVSTTEDRVTQERMYALDFGEFPQPADLFERYRSARVNNLLQQFTE